VKEQTDGLYAAELVKSGFIALAFDVCFQGESGRGPRFLEDLTTWVEDIRWRIDFSSVVFIF